MSEQNIPAEGTETEETEGHLKMWGTAAPEEEDTEGHVWATVVPQDEDTEGRVGRFPVGGPERHTEGRDVEG